MKLFHIILILLVGVVLFTFTRLKIQTPEDLLIGDWSESSWQYERVAKLAHKRESCSDSLSEALKEHLGKDLFLHENETWTFYPDGRLKISVPEGPRKNYFWRLKGRGDVLVIKDENRQPMEHYKITQINKKTLTLNFELDIQVKGLARMSFKKAK